MLALRSDASRALSTYALFYLLLHLSFLFFFFFNDTATTEIYTLSLHDALPILFGGANLVLRGPDGLIVTPLPIHQDRKSTRLNSSHSQISYAVFCLKKKKKKNQKIQNT